MAIRTYVAADSLGYLSLERLNERVELFARRYGAQVEPEELEPRRRDGVGCFRSVADLLEARAGARRVVRESGAIGEEPIRALTRRRPRDAVDAVDERRCGDAILRCKPADHRIPRHGGVAGSRERVGEREHAGAPPCRREHGDPVSGRKARMALDDAHRVFRMPRDPE